MKTIIDKPAITSNIRNIERMTTELSVYMNEYEIDRCVGFLNTISTSKWDINPTIEDSKTQLKILLGTDRYDEIVFNWKLNNQKLLSSFGLRKYKNKMNTSDKILYDGLDATDDPTHYEVLYV
jgi:hypothetical protein